MKKTTRKNKTKEVLEVSPFDIVKKYKVAILFFKSRSPHFTFYLATAKTADCFIEARYGGRPYYLCAFNRENVGYNSLAYLAHTLGYLKGTCIFIDGILGESNSIINSIVRCYQEKCRCGASVEKFCIDDVPYPEQCKGITQVPCKQLFRMGLGSVDDYLKMHLFCVFQSNWPHIPLLTDHRFRC